jgi:hypothetical protein
MTAKQTPVTVNCDENNFIDAILLLSKIHVDKEQLCSLSADELNDLAANIILQTCKTLLDALRDDTKRPHIIAKFISKSNLKYLARGLH